MTDIEAKSRFALIKENLAEVLNPEIIENILAEGRHPKIYWGESLRPPHERRDWEAEDRNN
jgi:tyrosyl-tRNA synthetase